MDDARRERCHRRDLHGRRTQRRAVAADPAGTYRIYESGGVDGYAFFSWNCDGDVTTYQITNGGDLPHPTLVKEVVDPTRAGCPLASASDFTLSASGPVSISGGSGSPAVDHEDTDLILQRRIEEHLEHGSTLSRRVSVSM
ncbi:hypothetical protein ACFY9N_17025 [Microbacterium sp. NPDC008134]|uniref:hypothetical protein n=1 Tax=Microbacterium sp. NPDC008134 TaxID=3364183 RepID=UPI0036E52DEB